jgi:hypothetical protein
VANAAFAHRDTRLAANKRLVHFDRAASTKRVDVFRRHSFADTVSQKPRALVGDLKDAVQLVGADPLLAAGHEIDACMALCSGKRICSNTVPTATYTNFLWPNE